MRGKIKRWYEPGEHRVTHGFLWLPRHLPIKGTKTRQWRWLEYAWVEQVRGTFIECWYCLYWVGPMDRRG